MLSLESCCNRAPDPTVFVQQLATASGDGPRCTRACPRSNEPAARESATTDVTGRHHRSTSDLLKYVLSPVCCMKRCGQFAATFNLRSNSVVVVSACALSQRAETLARARMSCCCRCTQTLGDGCSSQHVREGCARGSLIPPTAMLYQAPAATIPHRISQSARGADRGGGGGGAKHGHKKREGVK